MILFGFKGCGKTTFGKKLAHTLNLPFIDCDDLIGRTVAASELYRKVGEHEFRKLESEAIASLKPLEPCIIAAGGGTLLDPASREHLAKFGKLIYLELCKSKLQQRALTSSAPLFEHMSFDNLYTQRIPLYETIASQKVVLDDKTDDEIIEELKALYGQ